MLIFFLGYLNSCHKEGNKLAIIHIHIPPPLPAVPMYRKYMPSIFFTALYNLLIVVISAFFMKRWHLVNLFLLYLVNLFDVMI